MGEKKSDGFEEAENSRGIFYPESQAAGTSARDAREKRLDGGIDRG